MWKKKKYGLNLQACCDHQKRFTNVSIIYPGSTSDFLAFETSSFRQQLETNGFLANGLCLFGDNAYVNTSYMATPYPNVSSGSKDAYNFYHSQVRISIECAFGILVNHWGVLRKPISHKFSLQKICSMVMCLCQLHNFLVNNNESENISHLAQDRFRLLEERAVPMVVRNMGEVGVPDQLLGGNDHFEDDLGAEFRDNVRRRNIGQLLPREVLHDQVVDSDLRRPSRNVRRN